MEATNLVYLDLSKVFDEVPAPKLFREMNMVGIHAIIDN